MVRLDPRIREDTIQLEFFIAWMARSPPSRGQALQAMTALVIPESAKAL